MKQLLFFIAFINLTGWAIGFLIWDAAPVIHTLLSIGVISLIIGLLTPKYRRL